ncbi:MAG: hypothetical protein PHH26_00195 [Candidatus Thermoplasmatota archaeon]|nr:hypothetical protein [Candidatus Thermoplasmatota archaeon]
MYEGMLLNGSMLLIGAAACFSVFVKVTLEKRTMNDKMPIMLCWLWATALLAAMGARQFFAYAGAMKIDEALFLIGTPFYGYSAVPLAYLSVYIMSGRKWAGISFAASIAIIVSIILFFAYAYGVTHRMNEWGSEYTFNSPIVGILAAVGNALALTSSVMLMLASRKCEEKPVKRRLAMVGFACLVFYIAIAVDVLILEGAARMVTRSLILFSALTIYAAYNPSKRALEKIGMAKN